MNVQFDLNNFYMYKNQDWMSSKGYIRNSHVPKMWEKLKFSTTVFSKLWLLFFFILDDYTCKISMSLMFSFWSLKQTYLRHPGFQELLQAVYISGTASCHTGQWIHQSISCFVNFFMCSDVQYIDSYLDKLFYTSL